MKQNQIKRSAIKKAIKIHRKSPSATTLTKVFSLLDKSVKSHIIHKNKASRIKSRLSRLVAAK
jgi:small subunit ribosomal protein S20